MKEKGLRTGTEKAQRGIGGGSFRRWKEIGFKSTDKDRPHNKRMGQKGDHKEIKIFGRIQPETGEQIGRGMARGKNKKKKKRGTSAFYETEIKHEDKPDYAKQEMHSRAEAGKVRTSLAKATGGGNEEDQSGVG